MIYLRNAADRCFDRKRRSEPSTSGQSLDVQGHDEQALEVEGPGVGLESGAAPGVEFEWEAGAAVLVSCLCLVGVL
ncbi:hypothetical protein Pcinc_019544 [Petrolisthes cinctipes]|uniref:Uncharacterized protein n=1 Tax=Petrolisthes cinctipes TaxID=88211 RepID=A0AAE1FLB7_PETCI|nr:hypothetical protein Pcinc_019544 [Petrolisthes cinctipes]